MPSKYQEYRQMADTAERQLTSSYKSWTQFLRTAARLYKYPYNEQVMIHAQRPDATACAEYDFWNKKMGRFVRRGSTGIALIDTRGQKPQLRYVFDVADTREREHSRPMHLWQFRAEHSSEMTLDRPALQEVMEAVPAGKVDVVLISSLDRIGRDWGMTKQYIDLLTEHKVKLLCLRERVSIDSSGFSPFST